ncbi:MAG: DUF3630 family protein [Litorilituus sp.]|nr:DUF3630 family protein [Litorilituus sp.]
MSKLHSIKSIQHENDHIIISFVNDWYQEDIKTLNPLILSTVEGYQIKEHTLGADRETIRFTWQTTEFLLNFDYYSQSCWIDAHDVKSQTSMLTLYRQIKIYV